MSQGNYEITEANLKIKVPHWLVQVRIYDNSSTLIKKINEFDEPDSENYFEVIVDLVPGIYEIEYALAEKVDRKLIIVNPGDNISILDKSSSNWKNLQIGSSMPFINSTESNINYSEHVEDWSKRKTRHSNSLENSSLFLSIKIPDKAYLEIFDQSPQVKFSELFNLFDHEGNSVISFEEDLEINSEERCIIFNANLPHGSYTLKWISCKDSKAGSEISKCCQPIFIHRNWTTQVFLLTHTPSPKALALSMARYGLYFDRNDGTVLAAEALLDTLSQEAGRSILTKNKMKFYLSEKIYNPWLGVLAAYALLPSDNLFIAEESLLDESRSLFETISVFLKRELPDHPDVRSLFLKINKPAETPIYNPPLLKISLRKIQQHAVKHEATIICDDVIDQILKTPLLMGPWVSWEESYDPLSNKTYVPESDSKIEETNGNLGISGVFPSESFSAKLPIFNLLPNSGTNVNLPSSSNGSSSVTKIQEAALIYLTKELSKYDNFGDIPSKIIINFTDPLINSLKKVNPQDISTMANLPLSRVKAAYDDLKKRGIKLLDQTGLKDEEQFILKYAFQEIKRKIKQHGNKKADTNFKDFVDNSYSVSIEECVSKLETQSDLLTEILKYKSYESNNYKKAENFWKRLNQIAIKLLQRADFMVKTNSEGKVLFGNGAFLYLVSPNLNKNFSSSKEEDVDLYKNKEIQVLNQEQWEKTLRVAPLGKSTLYPLIENKYFETWVLNHIEIQNKDQNDAPCFLNILRGLNAPICEQKTLDEMKADLSKLSLYVSLFVLRFSNEDNPHIKSIEEIIASLESSLVG